jgi:hypothetical protein
MIDGLDDLVASIMEGPKRVHNLNTNSRMMLRAMIPMVERVQPITCRGVGYKMFVAKKIRSMADSEVKKVSRLLKEARERGIIPWEWIVDETRELERAPSWNNPEEFVEAAIRQYPRDFWQQQPERCEVWCEKGTIRGVLQPVLDEYGVGFRNMHGYSSATIINDIAREINYDARPLTALYIGDWDPSGLHMSEIDLPGRLSDYGGTHVQVKRIALVKEQLDPQLGFFPARDKINDKRYDWFVSNNYGDRCWEVDSLDPNVLRDCVEAAVEDCILDLDAWERCDRINKEERDSLRDGWGKLKTAKNGGTY